MTSDNTSDICIFGNSHVAYFHIAQPLFIRFNNNILRLINFFKYNPNASLVATFMSDYSSLLHYRQITLNGTLSYRQSLRHLFYFYIRI